MALAHILRFGPLTIYSYGLMMAIAFLVAGWLTGRELTRKGFNGDLASSIVLWAAVGGLVGARLLALIGDPAALAANPLRAIFSGAGFVWYGGLIGGFATVSLVIWRRGLPWLRVTDCIAPALAVGQSIGRIGCQLAGDGDWGKPSTLPWAMSYPNAIIGWDSWVRDNGLPADVRVHPAPVYETLAYGLVFLVLWLSRRSDHPDVFALSTRMLPVRKRSNGQRNRVQEDPEQADLTLDKKPRVA